MQAAVGYRSEEVLQTTNERWSIVRAVREGDERRVLLKGHLDSPRHTTAPAAFALLNRGKKGLKADLKNPSDLSKIQDYLGFADILRLG